MGNSYRAAVLSDSPIRYYRLDETSGTSAADLGSQNLAGTYTGGFTLNQTGLLTQDTDASVTLNGTTGYVSIPTTGLPTGSSAWSIECLTNLTSLAGLPVLIFIGSALTDKAIELYYDTPSSKWAVDLNGTTTVEASAASTNTTYHLVATYDGTQLRLYVNGSLVAGPTTVTANVTLGTAQIGCFNASSEFCAGRVDETAIYSTALSATRVLAHYNAAISTTNTRTITSTAALLQTSTRTITSTAALLQTNTRTITSTAALLQTSTRTITSTASLDTGASTSTRTIPSTAALLQTSTRTITSTAALLQTNTRTIPSSAALLHVGTRAISSTAALLQTNKRTIPSSASLGSSRVIPSTAALLQTQSRTIFSSAALASAAPAATPTVYAQLLYLQTPQLITASGNSGPLTVGNLAEVSLDINITSNQGTSPIIQFYIERLGTDGVYYPIYDSTSISVAPMVKSASTGAGLGSAASFAGTIRVRWVIGGSSSPGWTYSLSLVGK